MEHPKDLILECLLELLESYETSLSARGSYGKKKNGSSHLQRLHAGITGAFVRRRVRKHWTKSATAGTLEEVNSRVLEHDIAGTCSLPVAESLALDPCEFEELVWDGLEKIECDMELNLSQGLNETVSNEHSTKSFSFGITLGESNPRVFDCEGKERVLLQSRKLTIAVLWATWSQQSLKVMEALKTWCKKEWPQVVDIVGVSVDDEHSRMISQVKDLGWDKHEHFWSGTGGRGTWTRSDVARGFAIESVPAAVLVDFESQVIEQVPFLTEKEFAESPSDIDGVLTDAQVTLSLKIQACLMNRPVPPETKASAETDHAVVIDQLVRSLGEKGEACPVEDLQATFDEGWWPFPEPHLQSCHLHAVRVVLAGTEDKSKPREEVEKLFFEHGLYSTLSRDKLTFVHQPNAV